MKQFLKFIVSIIVILTIAFTVYFLLENASKYTAEHISGDKGIVNNSNDTISKNDSINITEQSGNYINEMTSGDNTITNLESSGDFFSGDISYTTEEIEKILNYINDLENKNHMVAAVETIEDSVGIDVLGIKNKDFFTAFNLSELTVTVQIAGSMVYIIPNSDFIDNVQYHYDESGNLSLHVRELVGVGGEIKYYFKDNKLIKNEILSDENIQIEMDDSSEILERAKLVYEKYIK